MGDYLREIAIRYFAKCLLTFAKVTPCRDEVERTGDSCARRGCMLKRLLRIAKCIDDAVLECIGEGGLRSVGFVFCDRDLRGRENLP